jgi:hypothetical protein
VLLLQSAMIEPQRDPELSRRILAEKLDVKS